MASRKAWGEFFARHLERYPDGVIGHLVSDWQKAKAREPERPMDNQRPAAGHNRSSPRRIAQMLAARFRRTP